MSHKHRGALVICLLVCLSLACGSHDNPRRGSDRLDTIASALTSGVQINCGGAAASPYSADLDFVGGTTINHANSIGTSAVTNPAPQAVYQTARIGNFTYTVPGFAPGSSSILRLHFAETFWSSAGSRIFNVTVNGAPVLPNFDIFMTAGGKNVAVAEQFTVAANASGAYVIQFASVKDNSLVCGIEISALQANGASCTSGAQCAGAHCVDGVCCGSASCPSCQACNVTGALGRCSNVAIGAVDPQGVCVSSNPASCGTNGTCNGQGQCALFPNGTVCSGASCPAGSSTLQTSGTCSNGACTPGVMQSCAPFACNASNACATVCNSDADCSAGNRCSGTGGACGNRQGNGTSCTSGAQCSSGHCTDSVCCASASCSSCQACNVGSALGTCANVAIGTVDPQGVCVSSSPASCGTNGTCNGQGQCANYPNGTLCAPGKACNSGTCSVGTNGAACTTGTQCTSGSCVDGICCATASCPACQACNVAVNAGTCSPVPNGTSCGACGGGGSCSNGRCFGAQANGSACAAGSQCASGNCVDGLCCMSASCPSCKACNVAGSLGSCANVAPGVVDPTGACHDSAAASCATNGKCDGSGGCSSYADGTVCSGASCPAGSSTLTTTRTCSSGVCASGATQSCAPYACNGSNACLSVCTGDGDCSAGFHCNVASGICQ